MRASALQFRYLFVTTARGLEVVDVTRLNQPRLVAGATVPLNVLPKDAGDFKMREKPVKSMDRGEWLKTGRSY